MSSAYLNRSTKNMTNEKLRSIYFGTTKETVSSRIKKQNEMEEKQQHLLAPNKYGWELEHVDGLYEHVKLTATLLGKPVELLVYKYPAENGLKPHLDICIPAQQEIHMTPQMLLELNQVVAEAKKFLTGESTDFFK